MAKTIPQLTDATTVNAADELIIQQGGVTKRATASELMNNAPVTATGSTTARTLAARSADVVNVRDFGASPSASAATNTAAIQAAITAGANRTVYFPAGNYDVDGTITVQAATHICGKGQRNTFLRATHTGNILVFQPTDAGVANSFLSNAQLSDITITRSAPINSAVGAGVWVRQCSSFTARNVTSNNNNECFRVTGGQLNSFIGCSAFASDTTISATEFSGCFVLEEADIGGGNYQPCYTVNITDVRASANRILDNIILVRSIDGLNVCNGYLAFGKENLINLRRQRAGTAVGAVMVSNIYMDCVDAFGGGITGTPIAIRIGHALTGGEYGAAGVQVSNCVIANNDDTGNFNALIDISKYVNGFNLCNSYIANSGAPYSVEIFDSSAASTKGSYNFSNNAFYNVSNASGGGAIFCKDTSQVSITGNSFRFVASSLWAILFDGTIDSACVVGNTVDDTPTDLVVFAGGMTINDNAVVLNAGLPSSNKHVVRLSLPTSDTSLPSGSMWNDGGTVKIKA